MVNNCLNGKKRDTVEFEQCLCFNHAYLLNCEGQYCWNKVYDCEYNDLAEQLLNACGPDLVESDKIPFWPAPTNAPGACSCDNSATDLEMANLWSRTREACSDGQITDPTDKDSLLNCKCCYWSISFLKTIESCPKYHFPHLRYDDDRIANLSAFDETWFDCQNTLPTANCKALGYNYTDEVYLPSDLPLPGTETMSNLAGQVTAPVSGWTYTWSAAGFKQTVTAFSPTGIVINSPSSTNLISSAGSISGGGGDGSETVTENPMATNPTSSPSATTSTSRGQRAINGSLVIKVTITCIAFQVMFGLWV